MFQRRFGGSVAVLALVAAACGPGASSAPTAGPTSAVGTTAPATAAPTTAAAATIGPGEGALKIVIWAGYAERGDADPAYDWVTPFEQQTGCMVTSTDMTDSNNGVSLIQSGEYDGISASGDATTRLIQGGLVAPIDTSMLPNYANVFPALKNLPHNTVDGVNYGVPHGRGPNLLGYNTTVLTTDTPMHRARRWTSCGRAGTRGARTSSVAVTRVPAPRRGPTRCAVVGPLDHGLPTS